MLAMRGNVSNFSTIVAITSPPILSLDRIATFLEVTILREKVAS